MLLIPWGTPSTRHFRRIHIFCITCTLKSPLRDPFWAHNCCLKSARLLYTVVLWTALYPAHKNSADIELIIIPYKAINHILITLYGTITKSLSADFSCASYKPMLSIRSDLVSEWLEDRIPYKSFLKKYMERGRSGYVKHMENSDRPQTGGWELGEIQASWQGTLILIIWVYAFTSFLYW